MNREIIQDFKDTVSRCQEREGNFGLYSKVLQYYKRRSDVISLLCICISQDH